MSIFGKDAMDVPVRELLEDVIANFDKMQPPPNKCIVIFINDEEGKLAGKLLASGVNNMDCLAILEFQKSEVLAKIHGRDENPPGEEWKRD